MGTSSSEVKISDKPILATEHIEIVIHPKKECGHCKSLNTICINNRSAGSIIGYFSDLDILCNDCGKYTLYSDEYDS